MSGYLTRNPCIDVCEFNRKKVCRACGRTKAEKKGWKDLPDREKHAVWLRVVSTHGPGRKKNGKKLQERYEKAARAARLEA